MDEVERLREQIKRLVGLLALPSTRFSLVNYDAVGDIVIEHFGREAYEMIALAQRPPNKNMPCVIEYRSKEDEDASLNGFWEQLWDDNFAAGPPPF